MDENTIGIVTFKVMFKGSDFIQIGLNDDPNEVFNFWRENSNKKYLNFRAKIFYYFQKNNADVIVLYENGTIYDGHMEKYSSP